MYDHPGPEQGHLRGERGDQQPGQRRTGRLLGERAQHPLDAVRGEQFVGGQQGRHHRRPRGVVEAARRADDERQRRELPQPAARRRGRGRRWRPGRPCAPTSTPISTARFGKRSAATPPISTATTSPRLVAAATTDRSDGPPPVPMTCHTSATSHSPSASSEADPEATSSRYSRWRNGRSARGAGARATVRWIGARPDKRVTRRLFADIARLSSPTT